MANNSNKNGIQMRFIEHLKKVAPSNISLVDEIADLLKVSNDSAYRRIRGETALSIDETLELCRHFKIPLDVISASSQDSVTFSYKSLGKDDMDLDLYFKGIEKDLEMVNSFKEKHIYFAAEDIPVFHHFYSDSLGAFKFYYWKKSILNDPALDGEKFDKNFLHKETKAISKKIFEEYTKVSSTEVWTEDTFLSTLRQLTFYWESGEFKQKQDALDVCSDFHQMLNHLEKQAELGFKFLPGQKPESNQEANFNLYISELMIGNNTVLIATEGIRLARLSFNTFNSLSTNNKNYYEVNEGWMKNLIKKSVLISGVSEKQRFQFFKKMHDAINKVEQSIENE